MTFSVNQPWDPLKVCVVGRSYPPEFYSWIKNTRLRNLFERIAIETEEDYQQLIAKLVEFGVQVIRPDCPSSLNSEHISRANRIPGPISMNPRDTGIMIGDTFYFYPITTQAEKVSGRSIVRSNWTEDTYRNVRGEDWPVEFTEFNNLPAWIQNEVLTIHNITPTDGEDYNEFVDKASQFNWWKPVVDLVGKSNKIITNLHCFTTRF